MALLHYPQAYAPSEIVVATTRKRTNMDSENPQVDPKKKAAARKKREPKKEELKKKELKNKNGSKGLGSLREPKKKEPKEPVVPKTHVDTEVINEVLRHLKDNKFRDAVRNIYEKSQSKIRSRTAAYTASARKLLNLLGNAGNADTKEEGTSS